MVFTLYPILCLPPSIKMLQFSNPMNNFPSSETNKSGLSPEEKGRFPSFSFFWEGTRADLMQKSYPGLYYLYSVLVPSNSKSTPALGMGMGTFFCISAIWHCWTLFWAHTDTLFYVPNLGTSDCNHAGTLSSSSSIFLLSFSKYCLDPLLHNHPPLPRLSDTRQLGNYSGRRRNGGVLTAPRTSAIYHNQPLNLN